MATKKNTMAQKAYGMLLKEEEEKPKAAPSPSADRKLWATQSWRRLTMAVMLLISTTRQQMVLDYMQQKSLEMDEDKGNVRDTKNKTKSKKDKGAWIDQGIGAPLNRSTAQKHWAKEPKDCNHPGEYLRCRANCYSQWWVCLTCGSRWERLQQDKATSSTSTMVPETPEARQLRAKAGTYPEHLPAPRSKPDQGNIQLEVDRRGQVHHMATKMTSSTGAIGYPKGPMTGARERSTSKERQPSLEPTQADHLDQRDGDSRVVPGRDQLGSVDRDGGPQQPQLAADAGGRGQRLLVGPDQLGGSYGQSLKKLLPGRSFSSMMILLCLNCCATPEMMSAFGSPTSLTSTTASSGGEFVFTERLHNDTPSKEPFAVAYFYEDLGRRVQQSSADLYGSARALPRPTRRFLTQELRKQPKIVEVYSPPRVNQQAEKFGFQPAGSLDLTNGWDFTKASHRKRALDLIRDLCPILVILSPPCTTFSQLRNLSNYKRAPQQVRAEEAEGLLHLEFAVQIANIQRRAGRGFLFEHPKSATSWHTPSLARLADQPDVFSVTVDMCGFGLKSLNGLPALKPTLLLTNVEPLATVLHRRCDGLHAQHGPLLGGQAHLAAKYTPDFVQAILQGIKQHVQNWTKGRRPQEDYWELLDNQVVRHHRVPRRGLFIPTGVPGCPVSVSHLASQRTTLQAFQHTQRTQTLVDDWRTSPTPAKCTPHQWTGSTTFPVASRVILPTPWQQAANFLVSSLAHPVYAYLDEETAFQTEWKFLFPSRRILGGGAAASSNLDSVAEDDFEDMEIEHALQQDVEPADREEDEVQGSLQMRWSVA